MAGQPYGQPPQDPSVRRARRLAVAGIALLVLALGLVWGSSVGVIYYPGYSYTGADGYIYYVPGTWYTGSTYTSRGFQTAGRVWVFSAVLLTVLGLVRERPRLLLVAAALPVLGLLTSKPDASTALVVLVGAGLLVAAGLRRKPRPVAQQAGQY
jgi:hypothetical protein